MPNRPKDGEWFMDGSIYIARRSDGTLSDGREYLDLDALFSHLEESDHLDTPLPTEARIGHVHLHVRSIGEAVNFYHGILGFGLMGQAKDMGMAFVSAGEYHHHIGLNTWQGEVAPPPPSDALGLRHFSIQLPDQIALEEVVQRVKGADIAIEQKSEGYLLHDPSQNGIMLTASS